MATILQPVWNAYAEVMTWGNPQVNKWPLMEGPSTTILLSAMYFLFVKKIGPAWMMDKKPYDLRYPMVLYNFGLVIANVYIVLDTLRIILKPGSQWFCRVDDPNHPETIRLCLLGYSFFLLKFVEFADTIFFVLRKKNKQISTLHVVHHAIVPIATWFALRNEPGGKNYFFPLINTFVHVVMYSYYGLAALGPSVQKYLWWKKYLTTFQMAQFVIVFLYVIAHMASSCEISNFFIYMHFATAGLFLFMFYDFFRNTYLKKVTAKTQKQMS